MGAHGPAFSEKTIYLSRMHEHLLPRTELSRFYYCYCDEASCTESKGNTCKISKYLSCCPDKNKLFSCVQDWRRKVKEDWERFQKMLFWNKQNLFEVRLRRKDNEMLPVPSFTWRNEKYLEAAKRWAVTHTGAQEVNGKQKQHGKSRCVTKARWKYHSLANNLRKKTKRILKFYSVHSHTDHFTSKTSENWYSPRLDSQEMLSLLQKLRLSKDSTTLG